MYKKDLQIGEQMPIKRITEDYLPVIVFYFLLLRVYLLKDILFRLSIEEHDLEKVKNGVIRKC
jgi:hypothetical protein